MATFAGMILSGEPEGIIIEPSPDDQAIEELRSTIAECQNVRHEEATNDQSTSWLQQMPNGLMTVQRLICPAASQIGAIAALDSVLAVDSPKVEDVNVGKAQMVDAADVRCMPCMPIAEDGGLHGKIRFIENYNLVSAEYGVRAEYAATHDLHDEIHFFAHALHGEIHFMENDKHVRSEYPATHAFHGTIRFMEYGKHVRTEYAATHAFHGEIRFLENDKHVRSEYAATHAFHGTIRFMEYGKHVRTEYAATHDRHGEIHFIEDGEQVRTEFAATHARHGEIDFFEDGKRVRSEYAATDARHGEICFFENGKQVRNEFEATHMTITV